MQASSVDIRNDWVEEINAAIETRRSHIHSETSMILDAEIELPGDVEPVPFPDDLAPLCQVIQRSTTFNILRNQLTDGSVRHKVDFHKPSPPLSLLRSGSLQVFQKLGDIVLFEYLKNFKIKPQ